MRNPVLPKGCVGLVRLSVNGPRDSGSQCPSRVGMPRVRGFQVVRKPLSEKHIRKKSTDGGEGAYKFRPNHRCLVLNLRTGLNDTAETTIEKTHIPQT